MLELPSSCPNAFQSLGLPVATGHPNEEEGLEDERARECFMKKRRCDYFNTQNQLVCCGPHKQMSPSVAIGEHETCASYIYNIYNIHILYLEHI